MTHSKALRRKVVMIYEDGESVNHFQKSIQLHQISADQVLRAQFSRYSVYHFFKGNYIPSVIHFPVLNFCCCAVSCATPSA